MEKSRFQVARALGAAALAIGLLLPAACHKQPGVAAPAAVPAVPPPPPPAPTPEPFTGTLPEVDGIQAIVTLRHPKLINRDLANLMTGVPETALLRMALIRFSAFGYPEFSDLAPGSNVGIAVLSVTADDLRDKKSAVVGFAKVREDGKLWKVVTAAHLAYVKYGDWVMIAKTYGELNRLKSPEGIIAYLEKPQAEDVVVWGRVTPDLLASLRAAFGPAIKAKLSGLKPDEQRAVAGYLGAMLSLASQVHSGGLSLSIADTSLKLEESMQFLPDTPLGTYFRYKPGPTPAIAQHVTSDALVTIVARPVPKAQSDLSDSLLDALIAVDYPPAERRLKAYKASFDQFAKASDGGAAAVVDLVPGEANGRAQPVADTFNVVSGQFTMDLARDYIKGVRGLTADAVRFVLGRLKSASGAAAVESSSSYVENALVVDGQSFDSYSLSVLVNDREASRKTQYYGVVDGSLVMADSRKAIEDHLPALLSKAPIADGIRVPQGADDQALITLNGGGFVDFIVHAAKLDLGDPDIKAAVDGLKSDYAADGPITAVLSSSQAKATFALTIPYKFIETSVHLGEFVQAQKINLAAAFGGAAPRPPAVPSPAAPSVPVP